jgi:hypothetical protein
LFADERRARVINDDGYHALKAFLPPLERRGLTLIDSSFDRGGEFERLTQALVLAHRRFATGVLCALVSLMEPPVMHQFERAFAATGVRKILQAELSVYGAKWRASLRGCGMMVINPPFGFEQQARDVLEWLWPALREDQEGGRAGALARARVVNSCSPKYERLRMSKPKPSPIPPRSPRRSGQLEATHAECADAAHAHATLPRQARRALKPLAPAMNIAHWLARAARAYPSNAAVSHGSRVLFDYAQLARRVSALSAGLRVKLALEPEIGWPW